MCGNAIVDQARHQLLHLLTNTVLDLQHTTQAAAATSLRV